LQLQPDIILVSAIKSLRDVVAPAVDPANKLAQEQVQVAIGLLNLLAQRLPQQFRFACDELQRLLELASSLHALVIAASNAALSETIALGADVLRRAQADPHELKTAIRALRETTSARIDVLYHMASPDEKSQLKKLVLDYSTEQLKRDRAWVITQGWEEHPEMLTSIETLLSVNLDAASPSK
jgi:hypothetical protein